MSFEIGFYSLNEPYETKDFSTHPRESLHELILSSHHESRYSSLTGRTCILQPKVGDLPRKNSFSPKMSRIDGGGEVRISAEWGGDEGLDIHIGASGKIHDDEGSYVKIDVSQEISKGDLGRGTASIAAGHEEG